MCMHTASALCIYSTHMVHHVISLHQTEYKAVYIPRRSFWLVAAQGSAMATCGDRDEEVMYLRKRQPRAADARSQKVSAVGVAIIYVGLALWFHLWHTINNLCSSIFLKRKL